MLGRIILVLLLFPCVLVAGGYKTYLEANKADTRYVQTPEDNRRLGFFSALFDMAERREKPAGQIPKVLHFIWLGPKPFPATSVANLKGWIDKHPGWIVRFWTDQGHAAPDDRMQVSVFDRFPLEELKELYYRSDNFGERSQLLRYAILLAEGGVYVDHDVTCVQPIGELVQANDFFCGMEALGPTVLSSSVNPSPHLMSSTAQHPILKATKNWLLREWDRLDLQFPGTTPSQIHNRIQHRTFRALGIGIKESHAKAGRKDVVMPPDYFSLQDPKRALFAAHAHKGSWYQLEEPAALKTSRLLAEAKKESARTFWMGCLLGFINMGLAWVLVVHFLRRQKRRKA